MPLGKEKLKTIQNRIQFSFKQACFVKKLCHRCLAKASAITVTTRVKTVKRIMVEGWRRMGQDSQYSQFKLAIFL